MRTLLPTVREGFDLGQSAALYCRVSIAEIAQTGLQFSLRSAQGKLISSLMAALSEFERDLLRERVRSGIAAARQRGG